MPIAALAFSLALAQAAEPPLRLPGEPPVPAVPARPLGPVQRLFRSSDYPLEAYAFNAQGRAEFRAIVDVDGRIRRCRIVRSSWVRLFGSLTCAILRERARFEPARDAAGNPVEDVIASSVSWGISGDPRPIPRARIRR
jgi:periplasmic protein TonB